MTHRNPRRAGSRWLEGAPEYVLDVFDNKGRTADRYTVFFGGTLAEPGTVHYLGMSDNPHSPQGVSMWGYGPAHDLAGFRHRRLRERIRWTDLPENIRAHVLARVAED